VKRARRGRDEKYISRKPEGKRSLKISRHRCKDNITTYDEEMKWETGSYSSGQYLEQGFMTRKLDFWFPSRAKNISSAKELSAFHERLSLL
jgi:hypothetical protein